MSFIRHHRRISLVALGLLGAAGCLNAGADGDQASEETGALEGAACVVKFDFQNQWPGGFQANVILKNQTGSAYDGWKLNFAFSGDEKVQNAWNASVAQSGKEVTATNAPWARNLPSGVEASFGFTGSGTPSSKPTSFSLNGVKCNESTSSTSSSSSTATATTTTTASTTASTTSSGAGGAGGAGGASGSGGSSGSGATGSCEGLPLCDDFEGAKAGSLPDAATWQVVTPNCSGTSSITVDGSVAHSGSNSIKVTGKGGYCNHVFLANNKAIGTIGKTVFGRFFMRLSDPLGGGHSTLMAMKDVNDGGRDLRMGGQNQIMMWNRESDDATLPVLSPAGSAMSVAPAKGAWQCVEFMVSGATGAMQTWLNGEEVKGLHLDSTPTPDVDSGWLTKSMWRPSLTDFKLGWESYAGQDMTVWYDDVALGDARIGCEGGIIAASQKP